MIVSRQHILRPIDHGDSSDRGWLELEMEKRFEQRLSFLRMPVPCRFRALLPSRLTLLKQRKKHWTCALHWSPGAALAASETASMMV